MGCAETPRMEAGTLCCAHTVVGIAPPCTGFTTQNITLDGPCCACPCCACCLTHPAPSLHRAGTSTSVTLLRCWRLTQTWCDAHRWVVLLQGVG